MVNVGGCAFVLEIHLNFIFHIINLTNVEDQLWTGTTGCFPLLLNLLHLRSQMRSDSSSLELLKYVILRLREKITQKSEITVDRLIIYNGKNNPTLDYSISWWLSREISDAIEFQFLSGA